MNNLTLEEIKQRICLQWDADTLLEVLNIDASDLVELLEDQILDNYDKVLRELED